MMVNQRIITTDDEKWTIYGKVFRAVAAEKEIEIKKEVPNSRASFSLDMKGEDGSYHMQAFIWDYGFEREVEWNAIGENQEIMERGMKIRDEILERMNL